MFPSWYSPPKLKEATPFDWRAAMKRVCAFYRVSQEDLLGPRRCKYLVDARWTLIKALSQNGRMSSVRIGEIVQRDHTTVLHACREFEYRAKYRPHMKKALKEVLR